MHSLLELPTLCRDTSAMNKAALVARLKKIYAAEDYFTGVLGNRHSVYLPRPKSRRPKATAAKKSAPATRQTKARMAAW